MAVAFSKKEKIEIRQALKKGLPLTVSHREDIGPLYPQVLKAPVGVSVKNY
ncbi:MAG: hypothetical protein PHY47_13525 [Lachnospiraceae bacterium]|nr:hypothetical protein [Lachnospiraceae bacterium]